LADLERQLIHSTSLRVNVETSFDRHRRFCTALFDLSDALSYPSAVLLRGRISNGVQAFAEAFNIPLPKPSPGMPDIAQSTVYRPAYCDTTMPCIEPDFVKPNTLKRGYAGSRTSVDTC